MKIDHLQLPESRTKTSGIGAIDIKRLGTVIALVGKNGAGKSRILELLEKEYLKNLNITSYTNDEIIEIPQTLQALIKEYKEVNELLATIEKPTEALATLQSQLKTFQQKAQRVPGNKSYINKIGELSSAIAKLEAFEKNSQQKKEIETRISNNSKKYYYKILYSEIRQLQDVLESAAANDVSFEQLFESVSDQEEYSELGAMYRSGLTFLAKLPNQLIDDSMASVGDFEKFRQKKSFKRYTSLKKYINTFLRNDLTWDRIEIQKTITSKSITTESQGLWKLDGREFNYKQLSDGEKTLFAFSLLFFLLDQNPKLKIQESIIIIDEPELHLHPEAEILVVEGIRNIINDNGQLWIATHSVNILSTLSYDEIFMVKSGKITSPGRTTPGDSLNELMGLEEHIQKLAHFITDISRWTFLNYMTQCFSDPDVIKCAQENDPEFDVFKKILKEKERPTVLLDFGAGQGRIYREIGKENELASRIEYSALEPDGKNASELKALGIPTYESFTELQENIFDFVWLCNVLHEINISEWKSTLNKIKSSLKEDGYLIIVEDLKMPRGEKISEAGFVVMDLESLSKLFSLAYLPLQILPDAEKYKDRILCAVISKRTMNDVTENSILESLNTLRKNVLEKIKQNRSATITKENKLVLGRESAFYSQLYINTLLGTEIINSNKDDSSQA